MRVDCVTWFIVDECQPMRDAADEITAWLKEHGIAYNWLGQGKRVFGGFATAISFSDKASAMHARLRWNTCRDG